MFKVKHYKAVAFTPPVLLKSMHNYVVSSLILIEIPLSCLGACESWRKINKEIILKSILHFEHRFFKDEISKFRMLNSCKNNIFVEK